MKQFKRDSENARLAGVCAGIANYFEVDVTLIRVAFVIGALFYGFPILLYVILALVAPRDE